MTIQTYNTRCDYEKNGVFCKPFHLPCIQTQLPIKPNSFRMCAWTLQMLIWMSALNMRLQLGRIDINELMACGCEDNNNSKYIQFKLRYLHSIKCGRWTCFVRSRPWVWTVDVVLLWMLYFIYSENRSMQNNPFCIWNMHGFFFSTSIFFPSISCDYVLILFAHRFYWLQRNIFMDSPFTSKIQLGKNTITLRANIHERSPCIRRRALGSLNRLPNRTEPNWDRRMGRMDRMTGWWMLVINSMKRRLTNVWCLCVISISITIRSTMNHILQSSRSLSFVSVNFFFFFFFRHCCCVLPARLILSQHTLFAVLFIWRSHFAIRYSKWSLKNQFETTFRTVFHTQRSLWWPNWMLRRKRRAKTIFMLFDLFSGFLS